MILIVAENGKPKLVPLARATEKPQDGRSRPEATTLADQGPIARHARQIKRE